MPTRACGRDNPGVPQPCSVRSRPGRSSTDTADDADLAGILRGDERSFERLVERHHGSLRRLAAAHGVTGPAEEEALVRTWSSFLELAGSGEAVDSVRALLATLALEELPRAPGAAAGGPRPA